jgi:hypothetical protein
MNPMSTFDPDKPCKVHDRLNSRTVDWRTGWAEQYRQSARTDQVDGTVHFDGLILDGDALVQHGLDRTWPIIYRFAKPCAAACVLLCALRQFCQSDETRLLVLASFIAGFAISVTSNGSLWTLLFRASATP